MFITYNSNSMRIHGCVAILRRLLRRILQVAGRRVCETTGTSRPADAAYANQHKSMAPHLLPNGRPSGPQPGTESAPQPRTSAQSLRGRPAAARRGGYNPLVPTWRAPEPWPRPTAPSLFYNGAKLGSLFYNAATFNIQSTFSFLSKGDLNMLPCRLVSGRHMHNAYRTHS